MIGVPPPNRDRFLAGIAERVAPDRVQALYLFAPMRQGAIETCVAVIVADQANIEIENEGEYENENELNREAANSADSPSSESQTSDSSLPVPDSHSLFDLQSPRPVVLTARYKHTLKGADRGKWELEIFEQADAPMATVEMVVRGVQDRLDDASDPERLGADALRAALAEGVWTPPQR